MNRQPMIVITMLGTVALSGCGGVETILTSPAPTITVEVTQEPTQPHVMPPLAEESEWVMIEIPDEGLHFEIPGGWLRPTNAWEWTPDANSTSVIGVKWADIPAGSEVEAVILPLNSVILAREDAALGWTQAGMYSVEVYNHQAGNGTVQAVEKHAIVVLSSSDTRRAYDLYASAPTAPELAALEPVLERMLTSLSIAD